MLSLFLILRKDLIKQTKYTGMERSVAVGGVGKLR